MARVERAMAMGMKRVMEMATKRAITCKRNGDGKEDSNGKQQ